VARSLLWGSIPLIQDSIEDLKPHPLHQENYPMIRRSAHSVLLGLIVASIGFAQGFQFYPDATYSEAIPTLKEVVGHSWGEAITVPSDVLRYLNSLSVATPMIKLVNYGETWEGRPLHYVVITSEQNMARLGEIQEGMQKLADPRSLSRAEADLLIASLPAITWLSYGIHGNEISSTDAALLTAYHLLASKGDNLSKLILDETVVILDPMQNPDGRQRFVNYFEQTRGPWPDGDLQAAEHRETWPGGRGNHYLFDMNRDWFKLTQPESQGRVKAFLDWYPVVFADLHEMGSNSTYYFAPPAEPLNPEMPKPQVEWLNAYGKHNAARFDKMKFDYFTREVFDSFYPGYGEGWPMFHGAIGMTYEQASTRGLVVKRDDETVMLYRETVQHHFISSLSTCEMTALNREKLLRYFFEYRQSAIDEGKKEDVKEYIIAPGSDPNRARDLVGVLMAQGVEVHKAEASFRNRTAEDYYGISAKDKSFPAGTYVIALDQPAKRLAKNLLEKQIPMDAKFIEEQVRRQRKRLRDEIYDVTAWSLPLIYDVEAYMAQEKSSGSFRVATGEDLRVQTVPPVEQARLAYVIPWGTNSAARALASLLKQGVRVHSADKEFVQDGRKFTRGSLVVKVKNNPDSLHAMLQRLASEENIEIIATHSGWVDEGPNFGSGNVRFVKKPKIALAYNSPTSSLSAGATRFVLERKYAYPVTVIRTDQLRSAELSKYNVLILPDTWGGYDRDLGESGARQIKDWVQKGGTLITSGGATQWLTGEKVGLLGTSRELKGGKPEKAEEEKDKPEQKEKPKEEKPDISKPFDVEKEIQPEKELPPSVAGAIVRVSLDQEHWLTNGYDADANVMVSSRNIFTPVKLNKGRNVGLYMSEEKFHLSGFVWEESKKQLPNKAYLLHQPFGRGHVVAFAEDPNFRAFFDGLNVLFLNGVFFGPAH
jgi:hypothetical protein